MENRVLFLSGFLDLFGVSMIMPLISPHIRDIGASPTTVGSIGSVYGGVQLLSSPIMGQWSDVSGRRYCLLWSLVMTAVGYVTLASTSFFTVIILSRVITGIFKHSQNITKTLLADVTTKHEQSSVMGTFNAASSFGFIVGPLIGGHIAETSYGFEKVAVLSGATFILNAGIVYLFVEKKTPVGTTDVLTKTDSTTSMKKITSEELDFSPKLLLKTFRSIDWRCVWDLFLIKFCLGFSVILFRSNFSLVMRESFQTTPKTIGYLTSYTGFVSAFFGLLVGYIAKLYQNDARLFFHMSIFQVFTLFALSFTESFWVYVLFLTPLSLITTVSRVAGTSLTIQRVNTDEIGTIMGFSQSVMSIARMLAPFVSGLVLEISLSGPSIIGSFVSLFAVVLMYIKPQDVSFTEKNKKAE